MEFFLTGFLIGQDIPNQNKPHSHLSNFMDDVLKLMLKSLLMTYCLFLRFPPVRLSGKEITDLKGSSIINRIISHISACYREIY